MVILKPFGSLNSFAPRLASKAAPSSSARHVFTLSVDLAFSFSERRSNASSRGKKPFPRGQGQTARSGMTFFAAESSSAGRSPLAEAKRVTSEPIPPSEAMAPYPPAGWRHGEMCEEVKRGLPVTEKSTQAVPEAMRSSPLSVTPAPREAQYWSCVPFITFTPSGSPSSSAAEPFRVPINSPAGASFGSLFSLVPRKHSISSLYLPFSISKSLAIEAEAGSVTKKPVSFFIIYSCVVRNTPALRKISGSRRLIRRSFAAAAEGVIPQPQAR